MWQSQCWWCTEAGVVVLVPSCRLVLAAAVKVGGSWGASGEILHRLCWCQQRHSCLAIFPCWRRCRDVALPFSLESLWEKSQDLACRIGWGWYFSVISFLKATLGAFSVAGQHRHRSYRHMHLWQVLYLVKLPLTAGAFWGPYKKSELLGRACDELGNDNMWALRWNVVAIWSVIEIEGVVHGAEVEAAIGMEVFSYLETTSDSMCHLVTCSILRVAS
jgi:hypothetical protein